MSELIHDFPRLKHDNDTEIKLNNIAITMDGEDIQALIESNKPSQIEDLKKKFYEQFNASKL